MARQTLPKPTTSYINRRLNESGNLDAYFLADPAVRTVFAACPGNRLHCNVLAKATVLNALYNTRIIDICPVVKRIIELDIDQRLGAGDDTLVADIAKVTIRGKVRNNYSFASKYCAWHEPDQFPIFDRRVAEMLWAYRERFAFARFEWEDLRDYPKFKRISDRFRKFFGLENLSRKQIDKFLWIEHPDNEAD